MSDTFNNIIVGKKFKMPSGIVYQKVDTKNAKPVLDKKNNEIKNGEVTSIFYNSNNPLTVVS